MNDEKKVKNTVKFEVTGSLNRIVLDAGNNPVDGMVIYFTTEKGSTGSIEMAMKEYTKEKALKIIAKKAERLEELLP